MKVAIIGAGFTGLAAAYYLTSKGHEVDIFESQEKPGGLAIGFKKRGWAWPLEKHYHHIFTSDRAIRSLAKAVNHKIIFTRPKTSFFVNGNSYQLDSAQSLLAFPFIPFLDKLKTGATLFFLKNSPFWKPLENITAVKFLTTASGESSWRVLWQPLFKSKFGKYKNKIPASWFWARIKKRSAILGYPAGGFESLAESIKEEIIENSGKFHFNKSIVLIKSDGDKILIKSGVKKNYFDKVICTLPTPAFTNITQGLPKSYIKKYSKLKGLGAINLVLILKKGFHKDKTYWLNIGNQGFPFLGTVEHTNFMSSQKYNKDKILYVGNYLEATHPYFSKNEHELFEEFYPYLKRINPKFNRSWIKKLYVFKAPFAQPIVTLKHSRLIPPLDTPIKHVYLANIQQVYPWDRGTNYAVELGKKVAKLVEAYPK